MGPQRSLKKEEFSAELVEELPQANQRPGAMADLVFDIVSQLCEGLGMAFRHKQWIVSKSMGAGCGPGDPPLAGAVDGAGFGHEFLFRRPGEDRGQGKDASKAGGAAFFGNRGQEAHQFGVVLGIR